jgi:hypothetical protein
MFLFGPLSWNLPKVIRENTNAFNQESRCLCQELQLRSPECEALDRHVRYCAPFGHLK